MTSLKKDDLHTILGYIQDNDYITAYNFIKSLPAIEDPRLRLLESFVNSELEYFTEANEKFATLGCNFSNPYFETKICKNMNLLKSLIQRVTSDRDRFDAFILNGDFKLAQGVALKSQNINYIIFTEICLGGENIMQFIRNNAVSAGTLGYLIRKGLIKDNTSELVLLIPEVDVEYLVLLKDALCFECLSDKVIESILYRINENVKGGKEELVNYLIRALDDWNLYLYAARHDIKIIASKKLDSVLSECNKTTIFSNEADCNNLEHNNVTLSRSNKFTTSSNGLNHKNGALSEFNKITISTNGPDCHELKHKTDTYKAIASNQESELKHEENTNGIGKPEKNTKNSFHFDQNNISGNLQASNVSLNYLHYKLQFLKEFDLLDYTLQRTNSFNEILIIKGACGGCLPKLRKYILLFRYFNDELISTEIKEIYSLFKENKDLITLKLLLAALISTGIENNLLFAFKLAKDNINEHSKNEIGDTYEIRIIYLFLCRFFFIIDEFKITYDSLEIKNTLIHKMKHIWEPMLNRLSFKTKVPKNFSSDDLYKESTSSTCVTFNTSMVFYDDFACRNTKVRSYLSELQKIHKHNIQHIHKQANNGVLHFIEGGYFSHALDLLELKKTINLDLTENIFKNLLGKKCGYLFNEGIINVEGFTLFNIFGDGLLFDEKVFLNDYENIGCKRFKEMIYDAYTRMITN